MSADIAKAWVKKQEGLNALPKWLLMALADYVDEEYKCFPSVATLSKHTAMHPNSITRNMGILIEGGFVTKVEQGSLAAKKSNVYQLNIENAPIEVKVLPKKEVVVPARFEEFWEIYRQYGGRARDGKQRAMKAFAKIKPDEIDEVIEGAKRLVRYRPIPTEFIRLASTWLNDKGWNDKIDAASTEENFNQDVHRFPDF